MLLDRQIDFSDTKEEEWNLLRSKIGDGIELPLPDSERWFLATLDGENIKIEGAKKNVRPLLMYKPAIITFKEFARVAEHYNSFFTHDVNTMEAKLELQKTMANLRFVFNLIYNLL
ncbi:MAG TPA: hypothetical protein VHT73_12085 [Thermodesulfobacteriota bacterium]|nr:hypothetical protein [Thermodesulfobacteriota bacterium]